jgi:hypothetical protein
VEEKDEDEEGAVHHVLDHASGGVDAIIRKSNCHLQKLSDSHMYCI